jgi:arginine utilization protein RocB
VNGHPVHVVYIDKLEGVMETSGPDDALRDIYLHIDPEDWVVRQMEYSAPFTDEEGQVREVHPVIRNRDFRDVKGMMIPYETATTISGLAMTEEERQEAKRFIKEVEEQLEEMPEQQRKMAKQMMGDRLKEAKQALKENQIERVREVKEVRVNTGMEDF